jgi:hypothetical protein
MSSATARLLERLEGVKAAGPGRWYARCPAHEDRHPSLSVAEARAFAGAVVHCKAGCSTVDVCGALGWTLRDLYDDPREFRTGQKQKPLAADLLRLLNVEAHVVLIVARDIQAGRPLADDAMPRLEQACDRLARAVGTIDAR